MVKNIKNLLILLVGVLMSSCSSVYHTANAVQVDNNVMALSVAELDVAPQRMELTYNWNYHLFSSPNIPAMMTNVRAQILRQCNSDVLVDEDFVIKRRGFMRGGSITISGFPARYRNFHNPAPEELMLIESVIKEKNCIVKKSKKKFFFF